MPRKVVSATIFHHVDNVQEVSTGRIHLVDECDTGNMVMFSLTPYRFRLRFYAALCGENSNRAVEYAQRAFNFNREVNVPRSIDDVDAVSLPAVVAADVMVIPRSCS